MHTDHLTELLACNKFPSSLVDEARLALEWISFLSPILPISGCVEFSKGSTF